MHTILDCYTDEASGLGVPPFLGTYPRYLFGYLKSKGITPNYLTIDDLRLFRFYHNKIREVTEKDKTNIRTYNRTGQDVEKILSDTDTLIIILGVHVPGKYLSAIPGTIREIRMLLKGIDCKIILTGPAIDGTQLEGGKKSEDLSGFDVERYDFSFSEISNHAVEGASLMKVIPALRVIEIETARGCNIGTCSFCTEPLKHKFENRKTEDILSEMQEFYRLGARYFRIGKQSDFYAIEDPIGLLKKIRETMPDIIVLHIDNVNPVSVVSEKGKEITKAVVKYCTPGNVAALGVESFDPSVVKRNKLNCNPETAMKAIKIINEYGSDIGDNGMQNFLPGINLLFGLMDESKKTHVFNMDALSYIMSSGLLLRRINIRQTAILPGTKISKEAGTKYLRKNKKHYWKWRDQIRKEIDYPMLKRLVQKGSMIKEVRSEIYDGKTTFARQIGTYPLIIGIKRRVPLNKFYSVEVKSHMLRSIVGEIREETDTLC